MRGDGNQDSSELFRKPSGANRLGFSISQDSEIICDENHILNKNYQLSLGNIRPPKIIISCHYAEIIIIECPYSSNVPIAPQIARRYRIANPKLLSCLIGYIFT